VSGSSADQGAQPHDEFLHAERLDEVIVGAGLEAFDLVRPTVARGEDQHRQPASGRAPSLQHGDAGHLGQAEIEHGGVVGLGVPEVLSVFAVQREVDDEVLGLERARRRWPVRDRLRRAEFSWVGPPVPAIVRASS